MALRHWVETDPGLGLRRQLAKVCQSGIEDCFCFHGDIWKGSEPKIMFLGN